MVPNVMRCSPAAQQCSAPHNAKPTFTSAASDGMASGGWRATQHALLSGLCGGSKAKVWKSGPDAAPLSRHTSALVRCGSFSYRVVRARLHSWSSAISIYVMAMMQRLSQAVGRLGASPVSINMASQVAEALQSVKSPAQQGPPCWVFLGPPGVGKGTYSGRIAEAMGVPHISAGDLVRDEISLQSDVGLKVRTSAQAVHNESCFQLDALLEVLIDSRM